MTCPFFIDFDLMLSPGHSKQNAPTAPPIYSAVMRKVAFGVSAKTTSRCPVEATAYSIIIS